ncbi:MAG TPA: MFS transporter [Tepidisphaeraceae bacterium]|nr:MFS transporter [Tepidisphaeraceae bacterium]
MNSSLPTTEPIFPQRLVPLFFAQAMVTLGTTFLQLGFFFYATDRWGWEPRQNLSLAAVQGLAYVVGALCSSAITRRIGRKGSIILLPTAFCIVALLCGLLCKQHVAVVSLLVLLYFLTAAYWPVLESLVAAGANADDMARRLSVYNLIWPFVGAVATAICGLVIAHLPTGLFYISAAINALGALIIWMGGHQPAEKLKTAIELPTPPPEPALLRQRTLALWLSRIALPSTYLVAYALAALMPTLPSLASQPVSMQTAIGSIWLIGRWLAFCLLAVSAFWHTRPRLLIVASLIMFAAFVVICIPLGKPGSHFDLWTMMIAQFVLGGTLALIYSASLYFGMVLSDASTEHGGYHEALIGLGQILGPGVAAGAQFIRPGTVVPAVAAISAMLTLSLAASWYASLHFSRPVRIE